MIQLLFFWFTQIFDLLFFQKLFFAKWCTITIHLHIYQYSIILVIKTKIKSCCFCHYYFQNTSTTNLTIKSKQKQKNSSTMAQTVVWECIRNRNSALVSTPNAPIQFSRERSNLRNVNTFTSSGLAHRKGIQLSTTKKGIRLALRSAKATAQRRPLHSQAVSKHESDRRRNFRAIAKRVGQYAPGLKRAALARAYQLVSFYWMKF